MTKWVALLMNKGESCVNNGGWLTDFYNLQQGLKQGCPCSPLTYLLVAELLALKIKQNQTIKEPFLRWNGKIYFLEKFC